MPTDPSRTIARLDVQRGKRCVVAPLLCLCVPLDTGLQHYMPTFQVTSCVQLHWLSFGSYLSIQVLSKASRTQPLPIPRRAGFFTTATTIPRHHKVTGAVKMITRVTQIRFVPTLFNKCDNVQHCENRKQFVRGVRNDVDKKVVPAIEWMNAWHFMGPRNSTAFYNLLPDGESPRNSQQTNTTSSAPLRYPLNYAHYSHCVN
jgi:hypothetical protein